MLLHKKVFPNLETYQIIKAVGRLDVSPRRKNFLISCLNNKNLDKTSRLAAASALTRYPIKHASDTLKTQRIYLNSIGQENWGDVFLETLQNRIAYENLMRPIRAQHILRPSGNKDAFINRAFSNSHPLALPEFKKIFRFLTWHGDEDFKKVVKISLIDMSRNLDKFNQPWNTYSDAAYTLSFIIHVWGESLRFKNTFRQMERIEFKANVQNAIQNHFEE